MFEKIARLADLAQEFPEFETEFQTMILYIARIKPNPRKPTITELEDAKRIYETEGKLYAVKFWKNHFDMGLIDSKYKIEDLASMGGWNNPNKPK
jgi:hypothetical protein